MDIPLKGATLVLNLLTPDKLELPETRHVGGLPMVTLKHGSSQFLRFQKRLVTPHNGFLNDAITVLISMHPFGGTLAFGHLVYWIQSGKSDVLCAYKRPTDKCVLRIEIVRNGEKETEAFVVLEPE